MPGPMSAPNGTTSTWAPREGSVTTGKTALKHGRIEHQTKVDKAKRMQKEAKRQHDLNVEG